MTVNFEFDESPTVLAAVKSVASEGLIGAALTGLMILLFLRDPRSVIVVVANIPLALLGSLFGLWLTGNTINIMSLGGLALAIGILVDEATVTVENVHVQMKRSPKLATAVLRGNNITAVPRLLALLCILSVFIPAFIMGDPLRSLFMPLTLAVGFAMISSYLLSSTLVPILCVFLLKHTGETEESKGLFDRVQHIFKGVVEQLVRWRWIVVPGYLTICGLVLWLVGLQLGRELFPQVDSGEFVLRFRPPAGSNFELTRADGGEVPRGDRARGEATEHRDHDGLRGPGRPQLRDQQHAALHARARRRPTAHRAPREQRDQARRVSRAAPRGPPETGDPLDGGAAGTGRVVQGESGTARQYLDFRFRAGRYRVRGHELRLTDADRGPGRRHRSGPGPPARGEDRRRNERIPFLRDILFAQTLDYPTVNVDVDREKAGLSGVTVEDVGKALIPGTASTRFVALNYWVDVTTGFDYLVEVLMPPVRMTKAADVETLPIAPVNSLVNLMVRDVATVRQSVQPGEFDRSMSQRYLTLTANVEGEDMGRASLQVERAIAAAGKPPRGVRVIPLGQLGPMNEMFKSLFIGMAIAVFVILVLLTAYFQSPRLALISIGAVPGVFSGIVTILYVTGTTLNIESFMGSIMCLGVSVSNSVMLVTFMTDHWIDGKPSAEAAVIGASDRLRPILMTACAMTVGMVPMALALERGSQMQAPLGRAVIGGLVMSTVATLLVVPSIFALVIGRSKARTPSIYPNDPESPHYDPLVFAEEDASGEEVRPIDRDTVSSRPGSRPLEETPLHGES